MRQIILDTETTGLSPEDDHRIIEIGCLEMVNRRITGDHYHIYINPERAIDAEAEQVHGISAQFLANKPVFATIADDFLAYIKGAELIIHNAPFDVGFIDHELQRLQRGFLPLADYCSVVDSLVLARRKHPGAHNNLDALCKRYNVDNSNRDLHGALLDAELLAQVYLLMTGGQTQLFESDSRGGSAAQSAQQARRLSATRKPLPVIQANVDELQAHQAIMDRLSEK